MEFMRDALRERESYLRSKINKAVVEHDNRELSHWNLKREDLCISKEHTKLTYFNMV